MPTELQTLVTEKLFTGPVLEAQGLNRNLKPTWTLKRGHRQLKEKNPKRRNANGGVPVNRHLKICQKMKAYDSSRLLSLRPLEKYNRKALWGSPLAHRPHLFLSLSRGFPNHVRVGNNYIIYCGLCLGRLGLLQGSWT